MENFSQLIFSTQKYIIDSLRDDYPTSESLINAYDEGLLHQAIKIDNDEDRNAVKNIYKY